MFKIGRFRIVDKDALNWELQELRTINKKEGTTREEYVWVGFYPSIKSVFKVLVDKKLHGKDMEDASEVLRVLTEINETILMALMEHSLEEKNA